MSEIKIGAKVHVEFDGEVEDAIGSPAREVYLEIDGNSLWVPVRHCTVIASPVKVGDVVTAENIGQLPIESLIAIRRCPAIMRDHGDMWDSKAMGRLSDGDLLATGRTFAILRIGGSDQ